MTTKEEVTTVKTVTTHSKKKPELKIDETHDKCSCGKVKLKISEQCRSCAAKERMKKTKAPKKITKVITHISESRTDKLLMENFVGLQKVIVTLSAKLDTLTTDMDKLLKLFSASAETLVKKDFEIENEKQKEILTAMVNIQEQNKLIAKGITLIHGEIEHPESPYTQLYPKQQLQQRAAPPQRPNVAPQPFQRMQRAPTPLPTTARPMNRVAQPAKQAITPPTEEGTPDQYQQSIAQIEEDKNEEAPAVPEQAPTVPQAPVGITSQAPTPPSEPSALNPQLPTTPVEKPEENAINSK